MKLIIDSVAVEAAEGTTILQAALEHNIYIPLLCKHPDLEAAGGCRLCVVEIEGREGLHPACETLVEEGMVVHVNTEETEHIRRLSMELMLASHPSECTDCPKYGNCELQSLYQYFNASAERWRAKGRTAPDDAGNPLIRHLFVRCIRCGRCVRACNDLRKVRVLDYRKNKLNVKIGTEGGASLLDAGCRFCGACVEVCPTGAITDAEGVLDPLLPKKKALVPCRSTCPGGIDIPAYLRSAAEGDWANAIAVIRERVPLPEVLGSICPHTCEGKCRRGAVNEPVSICRLKQFAARAGGDRWKAKRRREAATGKRVTIVGSGPAGLTAAYYLSMKGHEVTIFEAEHRAGGQLRYGIPAYRLPDELLDREIGAILEGGAVLVTDTSVERPADLLTQGFDAVLVAVGTHKGSVLPISGNDLPGVLVNTDFLRAVRRGEAPAVGERVVVLGGGNVAVDCARTALRCGAKRVTMACLETRDRMTASEDELAEAAEEGVELCNGVTFLSVTGENAVTGVAIQEVADFHFDENRRAVIVPRDGSDRVLAADTVIFAVGQTPAGTAEMGLSLFRGSYLIADGEGATEIPGVFAAGDVVTGTKSVIEAVAAGRVCAQSMDRFLGGNGDIEEHLRTESVPDPAIGRVEDFGREARLRIGLRPGSERIGDFEPVETACTCDAAAREAGRCLQCDLRLQLGRNKFWNEYSEESRGERA